MRLGKAHRNRSARGSFRAFKLAHWPLLAALERCDLELYQRVVFDRIEAARESRGRASFCIECRSLMAVNDSGIHFCPYEREGNHERVKAILGTVGILALVKSVVVEKPRHVSPSHLQPEPLTPKANRKSISRV